MLLLLNPFRGDGLFRFSCDGVMNEDRLFFIPPMGLRKISRPGWSTQILLRFDMICHGIPVPQFNTGTV